MSELRVKKTRVVKEDGRYLIYYTFVEEGEEAASPLGSKEQDHGTSSSETDLSVGA